MTTNRLEAFSDGVLAIIITIMVLELKIPEGETLDALALLLPTFITYILSFIYLGIYWNNHHHLMHHISKVNSKVLWANLFLLFWLSLFPFATGYMGENHFAEIPTALYGFILFMASISWFILSKIVVKLEGENSKIHQIHKKDKKSMVSIFVYLLAIGVAFVYPIISCSFFLFIAFAWLIPNKKLEQ